MATVIKFRASSPRGSAKPPVKVSESVKDVSSEVNGARGRQERFVALTDAETNKAITINPQLVIDIAEE